MIHTEQIKEKGIPTEKILDVYIGSVSELNSVTSEGRIRSL